MNRIDFFRAERTIHRSIYNTIAVGSALGRRMDECINKFDVFGQVANDGANEIIEIIFVVRRVGDRVIIGQPETDVPLGLWERGKGREKRERGREGIETTELLEKAVVLTPE